MTAWFKRRRARNVLERAGICPEHDIQREVSRFGYRACPECVKQANAMYDSKVAEARKILGLD